MSEPDWSSVRVGASVHHDANQNSKKSSVERRIGRRLGGEAGAGYWAQSPDDQTNVTVPSWRDDSGF